MNTTIIMISILGLVVIGLSIKPIKKRIKILKEKSKAPKGIKVEKFDFKRIKKFDEESYINDMFDLYFKSIVNDEWKLSIHQGNSTFLFERNCEESDVKNMNHHRLKNADVILKMEFNYKFNDKEIMVFNSCVVYISTNSWSSVESVNYKGDIPLYVTSYLYNEYVKLRNDENDEVKKSIDNKISIFKHALGKSAQRDTKINDILNGN